MTKLEYHIRIEIKNPETSEIIAEADASLIGYSQVIVHSSKGILDQMNHGFQIALGGQLKRRQDAGDDFGELPKTEKK